MSGSSVPLTSRTCPKGALRLPSAAPTGWGVVASCTLTPEAEPVPSSRADALTPCEARALSLGLACVCRHHAIALCTRDLARRWKESSIANKFLFVFLSLSRQKLIIPGGSCPVILNTYFCQKVVAKENSEASRDGHECDTPCPRRSSTLAQVFQFKGLTDRSRENKVNCPQLRTFHFVIILHLKARYL